MNKKIGLLLALIAMCFCNVVNAQSIDLKILPPSFKFAKQMGTLDRPTNIALDVSVEQLKQDDVYTNKSAMPLRIAHKLNANVNIDSIGHWQYLPDGSLIWNESIKSDNANGLIISFNKLYIPEGAELFIYTADKSQILDVYTHATNTSSGILETPILFQDEVVLEYVSSSESTEKPVLQVDAVGYVYNMKIGYDVQADDLACMINVNCEEGDNWQLQKKGVVNIRMRFSDGWYVCSGSLINNARKDKTPYILTANHCIQDGDDIVNFETLQIKFFNENPGCTSIKKGSTSINVLTGVELLLNISIDGKSDGALLKLKETIPSDWDVYYNGWDTRNIAAISGVSIHHPNGNAKTISTFAKQLTTGTYEDESVSSAKNVHWRVRWAPTNNGYSVTYGGSSGSPLFNQDGNIVGTLTGGTSYCSTPTGLDYYGKMSAHWNYIESDSLQMKLFLDPDNTGILVLDGLDSDVNIGIDNTEMTSVPLIVYFSSLGEELNINSSEIMRQIYIYNINGKVIQQINKYDSSTFILSSKHLPKGAYIVSVETIQGTVSQKVIK